MNRTITKEAAIEMFGGIAETARFFKIKTQAVSQWPDGELIPELREMQLKQAHPDKFKT